MEKLAFLLYGIVGFPIDDDERFCWHAYRVKLPQFRGIFGVGEVMIGVRARDLEDLKSKRKKNGNFCLN